MPDYRFYLYRPDGHIGRAVDVECGSDQQALARAAELKHAHKVEVWCLKRMVGVVPPA